MIENKPNLLFDNSSEDMITFGSVVLDKKESRKFI